MNIQTIRTSTLAVVSLLISCFLLSLAAVHVHAAAKDSSINLKQELGSDTFTLTIRDPDGIQEFSLFPVVESHYGGLLSGCKTSFSSSNVSFVDPLDFKPVMPAYVIDCKNNTTELELPPPVNGVSRSVLVKKETPTPLPPSPKEEVKEEKKQEKKEEKKEGILSAKDIQYPVLDLGNCQNETECRSYCDNADHAKACFAFAKKYNLISPEKAKEAADKFLNVKKGPGGCNSGVSCETYCNNVDHLDACIAFAEESGYYSSAELAEAKKFQGLIKAGKKFPGGCKDRNVCEIYCGDVNHMEECLNFAEENEVMPKEEIAEARKILPLMKSGETPGKCTSKEQCEQYCVDESHSDECIAFGEKAGFISAEDAVMIKKSGGKGPGGCHSKDQCETYCEDNSDACFQWAQDKGLVSEDDLSKMKKGMVKFKEQLDKIPPEVTRCLKDSLGEKNYDKMVSGQPVFDRSMEGKMKSCFSELTSQMSKQFNTLPPEATQCIKNIIGEESLHKLQTGEFDADIDFSSLEGCFQKLQSSFGGGTGGNGGGSEGFAGPGGCKSIDECATYCQSNPDVCKDFVPPGGGQGGGFSGGSGDGAGFVGPGSCKNEEECMAYCKDHEDECRSFNWPSGGGSSGGTGEREISCSPKGTVASFVCARNGKNAQSDLEITYFNSCTAKNDGAEILHEGVCKGHTPCADIADPVCGNDGHTWVSACYAKEQGGGVKYEGTCRSNNGGNGTPIPSPSQTSSCIAPPSGLVSWWSADIVSGITVSDISGKNDGTMAGGVTLVSMEVGSAFQFDGSSGSINMGNPANLNFGTNPFSLEAWFNWHDGGGSSVNNIIRKSNYPGSGPGSGYWLRVGNGTLEFSSGATTGPEGQSIITAPVSAGVWHHAVGTKDASGIIKLYVDGKSVGTVVRQAVSADTTSDAPFLIGAWSVGGGVSEFFNGQIDEVSLYNQALSASDVQNVFESGSVGKCSTGYGRTNRELPQDYQQQYQQEPARQYQQTQPSVNYSGPGGCKTIEECKTYCTEHYQDAECQKMMQSAPPSPAPSSSESGGSGFSGPGGCKTAEECQAYCTEHYQDAECQKMMPTPSSLLPFSSLMGAVLGPLLLLLR